jgi:hypothetical protein
MARRLPRAVLLGRSFVSPLLSRRGGWGRGNQPPFRKPLWARGRRGWGGAAGVWNGAWHPTFVRRRALGFLVGARTPHEASHFSKKEKKRDFFLMAYLVGVVSPCSIHMGATEAKRCGASPKREKRPVNCSLHRGKQGGESPRGPLVCRPLFLSLVLCLIFPVIHHTLQSSRLF